MMRLNFADPTKCHECHDKRSGVACDGLDDVFVYRKDNTQEVSNNCDVESIFFRNEIFLDHIFKNDDFVVELEMVAGDCDVIKEASNRAKIVKKSDIAETECTRHYSVSDWSLLCPVPANPPATTEESDDPAAIPDDPVEPTQEIVLSSPPEFDETAYRAEHCVNGYHNDYYKGSTYRGTLSTTVNGRQCQDWSVQTPHEHEHDPNGLGLEDGPYCRNPNQHDDLWCYTTDAEKEWEYCDVCADPPTTTPPRVLKKATRGVLAGGMGATVAFSLVGFLLLAVGLPLALYQKRRYK